MKYTQLGRSGLKVSRLALGTMNFGEFTDESEAHRILDAAVDMGINLVDTADVYGGHQSPDIAKGYGISEEYIGNWLQKNNNRGKVVLATKVYQPMDYGINDRGLSAYHIRRACDASLKRLKTDHIDLYQMHHIDRTTPWEEIWQAMDILIQQGKISYVGASNFAGWQTAVAQGEAKTKNMLGLISQQEIYNLNTRDIEREVIPACRHLGIGLIVWSPLDHGLLGGVLNNQEKGRSKGLGDLIEKHRPQLEAYEKLCHELNEKPADIARAWLLHNPVVTAPIIGPRTLAQLQDSLRASKIQLTDEVMNKLNEIWPGPNGEAPEAYAW